ncbi:MAG: sodium/proline symporter, partial [Phycisphaerales bacterium]|nr:sodium/proline symporter [Phycisphaerales bacterium]
EHIAWIDLAVIVAYLLLTLGLGLYQALKIKTSGDYYAGGRRFSKFYLMMHALGTASHADEPVSVIGGAYQKGLAGIWYTYLYLPLTPIFWLLAPYIRRTRFVTTADFFRVRYDHSLAILYSIMGVLKMSVSIGVVLKGTSTIFHSVAGGTINEGWAILAMTVVFVSYGFAGGIRATMVTESIQGPLIVIMSLLLVPFGLYRIGGFKGMHEALPDAMFSLTATGHEFTPRWVMAATLTALIGFVAQPGIVAAFASGKTELEGRVGYTYGTMIKRFCAMGWVFTGIILAAMVAQKQLPPDQVKPLEQRELAFGTAMRVLLPHGLLGLMFAAIFASQMATLSAQMVNSSALASRNLFKGVFYPQASDRAVLIFGRVSGIFLVAIGVVLAMSLGTVANALTMLLQFAAIMGVIVWAGVLWRRANAPGAWAAIAVLFFAWSLFGPVGMLVQRFVTLPPWIGMYGREQFVFELMLCYLPAGVVTLIVVSLLTPPPPKKQVDDFFMLLNTPVGQEQKLIDAGVPIIYAGSSQANALELKYPRLVHWGGFAVAALMCVGILILLWGLARIGS